MRYMYRKGHLDNQLGGQIKRGDTRIRWLSGSIDKTKKMGGWHSEKNWDTG